MLNTGTAQVTFFVADTLGTVGLIAGGVVLYLSFAGESFALAITGGWLLGGSLTCFVVAQIGRALVQIAENSADILELLDGRASNRDSSTDQS